MSEITTPPLGTYAPDFRMQTAQDEEKTLQDYRGSWLVLYFYPKDNTSGCITEALEFTQLLPDFAALGAAVVGVSKDSTASHKKFTEKHELGVTLLADPELQALQAYGAWRLKKNYGKESMGTVRSTYLIDPEGVVRFAWPKVPKAAGHAAKVLDRLRELVG